jgi:hypothetical protein
MVGGNKKQKWNKAIGQWVAPAIQIAKSKVDQRLPKGHSLAAQSPVVNMVLPSSVQGSVDSSDGGIDADGELEQHLGKLSVADDSIGAPKDAEAEIVEDGKEEKKAEEGETEETGAEQVQVQHSDEEAASAPITSLFHMASVEHFPSTVAVKFASALLAKPYPDSMVSKRRR